MAYNIPNPKKEKKIADEDIFKVPTIEENGKNLEDGIFGVPIIAGDEEKDNFAVENKKEETIEEYIVKLSNSKTTSEEDDKKFQVVLRKMGFDNAVVTCGIVYLDGRGTIENPPRSIQQTAGSVMRIINENRGK